MRPWTFALAVLVLGAGQLLFTHAASVRGVCGQKSPQVRRLPRIDPVPSNVAIPTAVIPASLEKPEPAWIARLGKRLGTGEGDAGGEVGVYVRQLDTGTEFSLRGEEPWYVASAIKIPVAVAVLDRTEQGELPLDARLRLEAADRVDGTGHTNRHRTGALLRVDYLLEQMLVYSDNTATDMLIRRVSLLEVNRWARKMSGWDFQITTLGDVRRQTYGFLHPRAESLSFDDWTALRRTTETRRVRHLTRRLGIEEGELSTSKLDVAYDAFYESRRNSGPLRAYGQLLGYLAQGEALGQEATSRLLGLMSRIKTGKRRLRATLPPGTLFAHKTGTQHRRLCDLGITLPAQDSAGPRVVIAACARNYPSVASAERALRDVGSAVAASGVLEFFPQENRRGDEPASITSDSTSPRAGASVDDTYRPSPELGEYTARSQGH